jgi:hypothetical protein
LPARGRLAHPPYRSLTGCPNHHSCPSGSLTP